MSWISARHKTLSRFVSYRLAIAAILVLLLQIVPVFAFVWLFPVHLLLEAFVSPLMQLALLALAVECLLGRAPRILLLVPFGLYGSYYVALIHERYVLVPRIEIALAAQNIKAVDFDPAIETLHIDDGIDAREMLIAYDLKRVFDTVTTLPSILEPARPELCRQSDQLGRGNPQWSRVSHQNRRFCVKREYKPFPAVPMLTITMPLTVVTADLVPRYEDTYTFSRNGEIVGAFTQSDLDLLSFFPNFSMGCRLEFPVGWQCGLKFNRDVFSTDGIDIPPRRDGSALKLEVDAIRIAAMLGLRLRSESDFEAMAISR